MAHLVSEEVFSPGFYGRSPSTEAGGKLTDHTIEDVEFALRLYAYNGGNASSTAATLETTYGIKVHPATIRNWSERLFPQRFVQIQKELQTEITDRVAGKIADVAHQQVDLQAKWTEHLADQPLDDITPDKLASGLRSIAQATSSNIEKAQLLRDQPTAIVKHTPDDALKFLKDLGIFVEGEAVEEADVVEETNPQLHS